MTQKIPKLAAICFDTPVKERVVASGMSRVNSRLLKICDQGLVLTVMKVESKGFRDVDVDDEGYRKMFKIELPGVVIKTLDLLRIKYRASRLVTYLSIFFAAHSIKKAGAEWVFCPCGANPNSLNYAIALSNKANLPLAVYLVDDFVDAARLNGDHTLSDLVHVQLPILLSQTSKVFVISAGLKDLYLTRYGVNSTILPLPYELLKQPDLATELRTPQIMFVGSLSHFYLDGLTCLARIIDEINEELELNIQFRFTCSDRDEIVSAIGEFECLRCSVCETPEKLHREMSESLFCYIPYSFDVKYKEMIETSFPSKVCDYLSAAKLIVVHGPAQSTVRKCFDENNLDKVVFDENDLKSVVISQYAHPVDKSTEYQSYLRSNHSYKRIRSILVGALKNANDEC